MRIAIALTVFCMLVLLGWEDVQVSAQSIVAGYTVSGGSTVIIITDESFVNLISKHDRFFISLGMEREFFQQTNPLNQPGMYQPVVIEAQRFQVEESDLDRAIQRLGQLIREAEKERRESQ